MTEGSERGEGRRGGGNKRKKCRGQRAEGRGPKSAGMRNWAECGERSEESRGCGPGRRMGGSGGNGVENAERTKLKAWGKNSEEREMEETGGKKEKRKKKEMRK